MDDVLIVTYVELVFMNDLAISCTPLNLFSNGKFSCAIGFS